MKKLKLEYLSPYLPYELKIQTKQNGMCELSVRSQVITNLKTFNCNQIIDLGLKPILRPLYDLIEDDFGFIYERESDYESMEWFIDLDTESMLGCKYSYEFWTLLFKHHFDVFGLIKSGLAININEL